MPNVLSMFLNSSKQPFPTRYSNLFNLLLTYLRSLSPITINRQRRRRPDHLSSSCPCSCSVTSVRGSRGRGRGGVDRQWNAPYRYGIGRHRLRLICTRQYLGADDANLRRERCYEASILVSVMLAYTKRFRVAIREKLCVCACVYIDENKRQKKKERKVKYQTVARIFRFHGAINERRVSILCCRVFLHAVMTAGRIHFKDIPFRRRAHFYLMYKRFVGKR